MKKRTEQGLTKLADAAFEQVVQNVIQLAQNSGTPVILCVKEKVKAVQPQLLRNGRKHARRTRVHHFRKASK